MRLSKSLLAIAAASTLAAATAFAEDSRMVLSEERDYLTAEELLALQEAHGIENG